MWTSFGNSNQVNQLHWPKKFGVRTLIPPNLENRFQEPKPLPDKTQSHTQTRLQNHWRSWEQPAPHLTLTLTAWTEQQTSDDAAYNFIAIPARWTENTVSETKRMCFPEQRWANCSLQTLIQKSCTRPNWTHFICFGPVPFWVWIQTEEGHRSKWTKSKKEWGRDGYGWVILVKDSCTCLIFSGSAYWVAGRTFCLSCTRKAKRLHAHFYITHFPFCPVCTSSATSSSFHFALCA